LVEFPFRAEPLNSSDVHAEFPPRYGDGDASYRAAGGEAGIRRLVDAFYHCMERRPEAAGIRKMHPADLTVSRDKLTCFLCGWLGGPRLYTEKYGPIRIPQVHSHLEIGPSERDAWLLCMREALEGQPYAASFKQYLIDQLYVPAERSRNRD
jgi:hemoglobin